MRPLLSLPLLLLLVVLCSLPLLLLLVVLCSLPLRVRLGVRLRGAGAQSASTSRTQQAGT